MSKRDDCLLLQDIVEAISDIEEFVENMAEDDFYDDKKTKQACIRNLEVIGEASTQLSRDYKEKHGEVEWREAIDLRNKIIHEYSGIDYVMLYRTIQEDLPPLKQKVEQLIENYEDK